MSTVPTPPRAARAPAAKTHAANASDRFLCVRLEPELYALPILAVHEIQAYAPPTPVPGMPEHVRGVLNVQGAIVPVVDLRRRLGLPTQAAPPRRPIVFVRVEDRIAGLVVDAASGVVDLPPELRRPPPEVGAAVDGGPVSALARHASGLIVVLDVERLLLRDAALVGAAALVSSTAEAQP
jgi:purine-binding chemotaxis protein CheW